MLNETYELITHAMCRELTHQIKHLKTENKYYRRMFTNFQISEHTGINFNSLGAYMAYHKLPVHYYHRLKAYRDMVIKANEEVIHSEQPVQEVINE